MPDARESDLIAVESLPQAAIVHVLARELVAQHDLDTICAAIDRAQTAAPATPFIIDMGKVAFMGSLAMGVLVGVSQEFKARGQRLMFAALQPNVLQAIHVSRIHRVVEIVPDVEAGVRMVGG